MLNFNSDEKQFLLKLLKQDNSKTSIKLQKRIEKSLKPIKPRSCKNKGAEWQKEICQLVSRITKEDYVQSDDSCLIHSREMGLSGVDVILRGSAKEKFPFDIECKNCEKISLPEWVKQAENNCTDLNNWLLFIKSPSITAKKIVVMSLSKFEEIMNKR